MNAELQQLPPNREQFVREHVWWVGICAEPDGDECGSGTNMLALSHKCKAFERWCDYWDQHRGAVTLDEVDAGPEGPRVAAWVPVKFDEASLPGED